MTDKLPVYDEIPLDLNLDHDAAETKRENTYIELSLAYYYAKSSLTDAEIDDVKAFELSKYLRSGDKIDLKYLFN